MTKHRHKKFANVAQNNVVYECHYCSYQNLKKGTLKGYMKGICPSKDQSLKESKQRQTLSHELGKSEKGIMNKDEANETNMFASQASATNVSTIHSPATPPITSLTTALEGSGRKRNRLGSNKAFDPASMSAKKDAEKASSTSSKRRRKSWTSLKEIAQSSEHNTHIANLSIPFMF